VPTSTVEQYIKTIYQQEEQDPGRIVSMKQISYAMAVTPGTATAMVKHLSQRDLVRYVPRKGVSLTDSGRRLALTVVRRHRLVETFLEQVLGYDWSEVHEDAERLEHAVSDRFIQRIDAYLGYPPADPHGDPIPSAEGVIDDSPTITLDQCEAGARFAVSRVGDGHADFLALMKEHLVIPGEVFLLDNHNRVGGTITIRHESSDKALTIGYDLGARITVTSAKSSKR
jgi:DtxR family transcriptional regulator, Mn-dependent transcriptional regulator